MNAPTARPTVKVNLPVNLSRMPVTKTPNTTPYLNVSTPVNNSNSNSNNNYGPVETVPLTVFKPTPTREVPKALLGVTTPNRPTREPWGKPGFLPSNAPPRRRTSRSRKTRRSRSRRQTRRRR